MITTPQDYYSKLHLIQDTNKPTIAVLLPSDEKTFNVNLSTRTIDAPEYLSVAKDHLAETIYFVMDRYYDGVIPVVGDLQDLDKNLFDDVNGLIEKVEKNIESFK